MKLDISPLEKAVARLREGLLRYQQDVSDEQIRDGLVRRFGFTHEMAHRMLKRYLVAVSPTPQPFEQRPFQDLIRSGNEQNLLLGDWPAWRAFRDMRSPTGQS